MPDMPAHSAASSPLSYHGLEREGLIARELFGSEFLVSDGHSDGMQLPYRFSRQATMPTASAPGSDGGCAQLPTRAYGNEMRAAIESDVDGGVTGSNGIGDNLLRVRAVKIGVQPLP